MIFRGLTPQFDVQVLVISLHVFVWHVQTVNANAIKARVRVN